MTRFDRRVLFTSGAAAALLAATGVSAGPAPKKGGRLKAALSGAARTDAWTTSAGLFMQAARGAVFENLTEVGADGTLRADLATRWASQDGGLTWVFDLAADAVFHDGTPLRAADIAASLAEDVADLDGGAIQITLNAPNPNLPFALADPRYAILPAEAVRRAAGIGTGLYAVRRFDAGRQFIGVRVPTHRKDGREGWFDEVELVSVPSEPVRSEALRDGLVDAADVRALDAYADPKEFHFLPSDRQTSHIVHRSVEVPATVGQAWPLDNLAMARRWWKA